MPVPEYEITCTKNVKIAEGVYEFRLNRPSELKFDAGQFVLFYISLQENPDDVQTRAFSIASSPNEDELIFVAKMIDGGRASRWISESLKEGDMVRTQGPFGRFLLNTESPKDYLFVCTSSGIAPFRSQILTALDSGDTRKMDLVFGARHEEDLFWQEDLDELCTKYPNLNVHYVLSQPKENWEGKSGHVQDIIPDFAGDLSNRLVYVCGNPAMTDELKNLCLEEWGVSKEDLHVEGYV